MKERVSEIKRSFRTIMDGSIMQSQKDKGAGYRLSWGASLFHLKEMAREIGQDYNLSVELWKEDIRECKILAIMIMPIDKFDVDLAELWMEQVNTQELAELIAFDLIQTANYAPEIAFKWIASENDFKQIAAYNVLSKLFAKHQEPNERGIQEFLDQAIVALQSDNVSVKHSAANSIIKFADIDSSFHKIANNAIKAYGFDFL